MKKLIEVTHEYYDIRYVGGGLFDDGMRHVKETNKYNFVDDNLDRVLEWFDANEIKFKDLTDEEYKENKKYYDKLAENLDDYIEGKRMELEHSTRRWNIKQETKEAIVKAYPELYNKYRYHKDRHYKPKGEISLIHCNRSDKYLKKLTRLAEQHIEKNYPDVGTITGYYTDYIF